MNWQRESRSGTYPVHEPGQEKVDLRLRPNLGGDSRLPIREIMMQCVSERSGGRRFLASRDQREGAAKEQLCKQAMTRPFLETCVTRLRS